MPAKTYAPKLVRLLALSLRHPETYQFADCYAFMTRSLLTKDQQPSQQRRSSPQGLFTQTRCLPPSSHSQLVNTTEASAFRLEAFRGG